MLTVVPGVDTSRPTGVDVVVVGAGQAGLSTAYHLRRRGFVPLGAPGPGSRRRTFVVLDGDERPGGAWQHRWPSLTMRTVNRVYELPGTPVEVPDPDEPVRTLIPRYFARYEEQHDLRVRRPVRVLSVQDAGERLLVVTDGGESYLARALVGATGTWTKPFWPSYPGTESFAGRQLHTQGFTGAEDFRGQRVVVVGGGISAVQHLLEIAPVATTLWVTRRPPLWREGPFDARRGHDAVALVEERARAGLPPQSVVSVTGLPLDDRYRAGIESGVLRRFPVFTRVSRDAVVWEPSSVLGPGAGDAPPGATLTQGGVEWPADTILWATGFRSALDHLAPLRLRERGGGVLMDGTTVVRDPRVQLVGYGPSASTIGANRAGRDAVRGVAAVLDGRAPSMTAASAT